MSAFLTGTEQLELAARMCVPYALIAVLLLLDITAMPYPLSFIAGAPFILMAIYYWSVYRPGMMPPVLVFAFGLLIDVTGGGVLGLSALLYLVMSRLIRDQRRFMMGQGFLITWLGFVVVSSVMIALQWLLASLVNLQFLPIEPLIRSIIMGTLCFPLISALLRLTHKII